MYRFYSLGETPIKTGDRWLTIFTGIQPSEGQDFSFEPDDLFTMFLSTRNVKKGVYIDGASLEEVASFLYTAMHNPESLNQLYNRYRSLPMDERQLSFSDISEGLDLRRGDAEYKVLPSFEPFISPVYVPSESQFMLKEINERMKPYVKLCEALNVDVNENEAYAIWTKRNAAFARLLYIVKGGPNFFEPLKYCAEGNHYWDWFEGKDDNLFVRIAYVINKATKGYHIPAKKKHPKEYREIPDVICPLHNTPLRSEEGFYIAEIPVPNTAEMHPEVASKIVESAMKYRGDVYLYVGRLTVNAKNLNRVSRLKILEGDTLNLRLRKVGVRSFNAAEFVYRHIYQAATLELR